MESALVPSRLLGELLIEKSLITPEELEEALTEQKDNGKRLGEILVKLGYVSGPELTTVLAEQLGVDMEKQTGFGSGLWSEIKRRHPRGGRADDEAAGSDPAAPETPREARLHLIDGLADAVGGKREPDVDEPAAAEESGPATAVEQTPDLQAELDAMRQQLTFAATRLDEERSAHEGTRRLLEEARAAEAETSKAVETADPAELVELNDTVAALRADLEAREAELAESIDARVELENVMAELESDFNKLRERHDGSDSVSAELADKVRELRVENDEIRRSLIESRVAGKTAMEELAALNTQLDARADELGAASEAQDKQLAELREELAARDEARSREADARTAAEAALAELRSDAETLSQSLDQERAAHVTARHYVERLESRCAELEPLEEQLAGAKTDLEARAQSIADLTAEVAAAQAALFAARSEAATTLDKEKADARGAENAMRAELQAKIDELSQSLDDDRNEHAAMHEEIERLQLSSVELEAVRTELADLRSEAETLSRSLDEERAAHVSARRDAEALQSHSAELAAEVEAVRAELAERPEPPPVEEPASAHIVFLPGAEGYALEARPGPAPEVGAEEELDGVHLRVARVGRSPLPADTRRCVFLEVA